ncbi:hypothetical protein AAHH79_42800, partial [Burkholderia pseudomallei]
RELHQHRSPLNCGVAFARDGAAQAVIGTYTGEGIVLRIDGTRATHEADLPLHANAVKGIAISGDLNFSVAAPAART